MDSVQFSRSVVSNSLRPCGLQHARLPCLSPTPEAYSNSCPLSQWCHPTISSSVIPFSSCPQSLPASGTFLSESVLYITLILLLLDSFQIPMTSFLCRAYHTWFPVFLFNQYCNEHLYTYKVAHCIISLWKLLTDLLDQRIRSKDHRFWYSTLTIDKLILLFVSLSSSYLEQQNERYLHLAAKLLDAKEQAATFKLEKNKQGQKEAQEKIRKFQRGKCFKILRCINISSLMAFLGWRLPLFCMSSLS